jgi:hypothetical protein
VRKILLPLLFAALPLFAQSSLKAEQHASTYTILMIGKDKAGCSATAISEHVLLTAEHCNLPDAVLYLNQVENLANPLSIAERYFDHNDHMLLVLPGVSFKHVVHYDPATYAPAKMGEHVYLWGNPALVRDQYREGYMTGEAFFPTDESIDAGGSVSMFAVPTVGGDSGSAIFSADDGRIVGITTYGIFSGKMSGSYPLRFTAEQVAQAKGIGNFVYLHNATAPAATQVKVNVTNEIKTDSQKLAQILTVLVGLYALSLFCKAFEPAYAVVADVGSYAIEKAKGTYMVLKKCYAVIRQK